MSDNERTQLDTVRRRADLVMAGVIATAGDRAKVTYATGDRGRSMVCISDHLGQDDMHRLRDAGRFECPQCGFLLKDRKGAI